MNFFLRVLTEGQNRNEITLTMSIATSAGFHALNHCLSSVTVKVAREVLNSLNSAHTWELPLLDRFPTDPLSSTSLTRWYKSCLYY